MGRRFLLGALDSIHGRLDNVRFNEHCDIADLGHGVFGGVLGILNEYALFLVRFCPVLFEKPFADPSLSRSRERLG